MSTKYKRLGPDVRREQIVAAALDVAEDVGYTQMTREQIGVRAGVTGTLVAHYMGTMPNLRRAVMRAAVAQGRAAVVAQGLAARDPHAMKAPEDVKQAARAAL